MIKEALTVGEDYAVLHGSVHDRSKARRVRILSVPEHGSHVVAYHVDPDGQPFGAHGIDVRLVRARWADWEDGHGRPVRQQYQHKSPAEWLRRIAHHPDAGTALRAAALDQLSDLG
jgi:hypothetical protein